MPRIPPADQVVRHHHASSRDISAFQPPPNADTVEKKPATSVVERANSIEAKYWHNRLISFCRQKIIRFINPPPAIKTSELVGNLTHHSREKDPQKVLLALKLHAGRAIKLHQSANGRLGFTDGTVAINNETMAHVVKSIKRNPVSVAYEYLRKGEQLPAGYLHQVMVPHMIKTVRRAIRYQNASGLPVSSQQSEGRLHFLKNPQQYIIELLERSGMGNEKNISFERMLAFKQQVRNNLVLSVEEQRRQLNRLPSIDYCPSPDRPQLPEPGKTSHFIEQEDRKHIEKLTSNNHFFTKVRFRDLGNSIKRAVLRNKRNHVVTGIALLAGAIITAIFPPAGVAVGIAIAIGAAADVAYVAFWSINNSLWHRVRLMTGLKKLKKYSELDYTTFDQAGDKKRQKLINRLRHRCQHKNFSGIYDAYAELEKQAIKLDQMAHDDDQSLTKAIALEKEQALYRKRRRELKANLFFFDKLIEQVAISRAIVEGRYRSDLELLWQEKFAAMDPTARTQLFSQVAGNLVVAGHQVKTQKPNWLRNTIKYLPGLQSTFAREGAEQLAPVNDKKSKLFKAAGTVKSLTQAAVYRSVKHTIFENLLKIVQIIKRKATVTISEPFTSKPGISNFLVFIALFFVEMGVARANSRRNQARADATKAQKKSYTRQLFGRRLRTGREEVGTLRSLAKDDVEPMVDHLLSSIKAMEKIGQTLAEARQRNAMLRQDNFASISNEDAARLILTHCAWQELLDKQINGAFSQFHDVVLDKARGWHRQLGAALLANSKRVLLGAPDQRRHSPSQDAETPSALLLQQLDDTAGGRLIRRFRRGQIPDGKMLMEIRAISDPDELRALLHWIDAAMTEESYRASRASLEKFRRFVNYMINRFPPPQE